MIRGLSGDDPASCLYQWGSKHAKFSGFYACLQHSGKKLPFEYHQTFNCQKYVIANHLLDVS